MDDTRPSPGSSPTRGECTSLGPAPARARWSTSLARAATATIGPALSTARVLHQQRDMQHVLIEGNTVVEKHTALSKRFPGLRLTDTPPQFRSFFVVYGLSSLEVAW